MTDGRAFACDSLLQYPHNDTGNIPSTLWRLAILRGVTQQPSLATGDDADEVGSVVMTFNPLVVHPAEVIWKKEGQLNQN